MDLGYNNADFRADEISPDSKKNPRKCLTYKDFLEGARTDSNRRHSEPQSDALTN